MMRWLMIFMVLLMAPSPATARELFLLGGTMQETDNGDSSYSWQLEYKEGLGEHFAYSLSYLNEGHVPVHHRDGNTLQAWGRVNILDRRLSLAAGAGPYYYFDTTSSHGNGSFRNDHGWGAMVSASATWYTESRFLIQLRTNLAETFNSIDTVSTLVGIGYQLEAPTRPGPLDYATPSRKRATENEITLFGGRTIVNSFESQHAAAAAVEYRRGIAPYAEWTVGWLYEGDSRLVRRNGLTTQLWGVRAFFDEDLALGFGAGIYISVDKYHHVTTEGKAGRLLSGIATMSASYRILPEWDLRTSWNRIITDYDRDTDVLLGGVGYRF